MNAPKALAAITTTLVVLPVAAGVLYVSQVPEGQRSVELERLLRMAKDPELRAAVRDAGPAVKQAYEPVKNVVLEARAAWKRSGGNGPSAD